MTMEALFTNDTEIEKVASFAAAEHEKQTKRRPIVIIATAVMVAMLFTLIYLLPGKYKAAVGLLAGVLFGAAVIKLWLQSSGEKTGGSITNVGLIRTGESEAFHYEFYEKCFTVTVKEKKEHDYSDIASIRDIGGAYQIKTADASYTVKKAGFSEGGNQRFKELMESSGIIIK